MSLRMPETHTSPRSESPQVVLELTVNNHPGVMSHICGLFTRRACIWLRVPADHRLEQMLRQLRKLEDVVSVQRHGADHEVVVRLEEFFQA